jgi:catechol 2,3-dioxygenase-like lactoylglutathione lyase family enzyme
MKIEQLNHVNVRTTQLDTMVDWYTNVLGLRSGARPNFPFPGAWMYAGDTAIVHLVGIKGEPAVGAEVKLKLEHFSLAATGGVEFVAKLQTEDIKYHRAEIRDFNLCLINIWDPDGNHIHVDFQLDE